MDSGFQALDIELFVRGTWIPDSNRWWDPDFLSCIPEAQDSVFHKQKFLRFRNPDSLRGAIFFLFLIAGGRHSRRANTCNRLSSPALRTINPRNAPSGTRKRETAELAV